MRFHTGSRTPCARRVHVPGGAATCSMKRNIPPGRSTRWISERTPAGSSHRAEDQRGDDRVEAPRGSGRASAGASRTSTPGRPPIRRWRTSRMCRSGSERTSRERFPGYRARLPPVPAPSSSTSPRARPSSSRRQSQPGLLGALHEAVVHPRNQPAHGEAPRVESEVKRSGACAREPPRGKMPTPIVIWPDKVLTTRTRRGDRLRSRARPRCWTEMMESLRGGGGDRHRGQPDRGVAGGGLGGPRGRHLLRDRESRRCWRRASR